MNRFCREFSIGIGIRRWRLGGHGICDSGDEGDKHSDNDAWSRRFAIGVFLIVENDMEEACDLARRDYGCVRRDLQITAAMEASLAFRRCLYCEEDDAKTQRRLMKVDGGERIRVTRRPCGMMVAAQLRHDGKGYGIRLHVEERLMDEDEESFKVETTVEEEFDVLQGRVFGSTNWVSDSSTEKKIHMLYSIPSQAINTSSSSHYGISTYASTLVGPPPPKSCCWRGITTYDVWDCWD
ncbi:hypothetical protein LR48_Vigan09g176300 [Vigna angularis]|uniref:Uncharacterized protein n=1 Tax=Phaseolus angularis TaxID=3914 RepID=A0A0L9VEJ4_PHAAN|nr:hypothetical protein LR48_Vigan09g176300 [Vigna angularis]